MHAMYAELEPDDARDDETIVHQALLDRAAFEPLY
jgi:hypothetical protein